MTGLSKSASVHPAARRLARLAAVFAKDPFAWCGSARSPVSRTERLLSGKAPSEGGGGGVAVGVVVVVVVVVVEEKRRWVKRPLVERAEARGEARRRRRRERMRDAGNAFQLGDDAKAECNQRKMESKRRAKDTR
jgi:hypothetical protein